jgi:hypothetical protein
MVSNKTTLKPISELKLDDRVLVMDENENDRYDEKKARFSRVVSFLHRIENIDARFVRIQYEIIRSINKSDFNSTLISEKLLQQRNYITLTPRHLILARDNSQNSNFEYLPAAKVNLGYSLKFFDFSTKSFSIVNVTNKTELYILKSGIYAPLTESGTLIVDNIHVSCFSLAKSHRLAQFFFEIFNFLGKLIKLSNDSYQVYSKLLFDLVSYTHLSGYFLNISV